MLVEEFLVEENLGKLKRTTKESCEDCGKSKLQLRGRIIETVEVDYLYCPKCGFEKPNGRIKIVELLKKQARENELRFFKR
jgi:ssDNA-binding Zn-finger/Zn-ribbon topoisomerase 1